MRVVHVHGPDPQAADRVHEVDEPVEVHDDGAIERDADELLDGARESPKAPGRTIRAGKLRGVLVGIHIEGVQEAGKGAALERVRVLGRQRRVD